MVETRHNPQLMNFQLIGGTISIMLWHADPRVRCFIHQKFRPPLYFVNNCNSFWSAADLLAHLRNVSATNIAKQVILSVGYQECRKKGFILKDFMTTLEAIVLVLRGKGCEEIIVTNTPPCAAACLHYQHWATLQLINDAVKKLCDENGDLVLCNIFQLFCAPRIFTRRKEYVINGISNYDVKMELYNMKSVHDPYKLDLITFSTKGKAILRMHVIRTILYRKNRYALSVIPSFDETKDEEDPSSHNAGKEIDGIEKDACERLSISGHQTISDRVESPIQIESNHEIDSLKASATILSRKSQYAPSVIPSLDEAKDEEDPLCHNVGEEIDGIEENPRERPGHQTISDGVESHIQIESNQPKVGDEIDSLMASAHSDVNDMGNPEINFGPSDVIQTDKKQSNYQDERCVNFSDEPAIGLPKIVECESQNQASSCAELEKSIDNIIIESSTMNSRKGRRIKDDESSKSASKKMKFSKKSKPLLASVIIKKPSSHPSVERKVKTRRQHSKSSTTPPKPKRSCLSPESIVSSKDCERDEGRLLSQRDEIMPQLKKKTTFSLSSRPTFQTDLHFEKLVSNVDFKNVKAGLTSKPTGAQKGNNEKVPSSNGTIASKTADEILKDFAKYERNTIAYEISKLQTEANGKKTLSQNSTAGFRPSLIDLTLSDDKDALPMEKRRACVRKKKGKKRKRRDSSGARKPTHKTPRVYNDPTFLSHSFLCECNLCRIGHRQLLHRLWKLVEELDLMADVENDPVEV